MKRGNGLRCPNCDAELTRLGKSVNGKWEATNGYRCADCLTGQNRFVWLNGKLIPQPLIQERAE